jgi:hypothetical protein
MIPYVQKILIILWKCTVKRIQTRFFGNLSCLYSPSHAQWRFSNKMDIKLFIHSQKKVQRISFLIKLTKVYLGLNNMNNFKNFVKIFFDNVMVRCAIFGGNFAPIGEYSRSRWFSNLIGEKSPIWCQRVQKKYLKLSLLRDFRLFHRDS